ncbi:ER membrane protein complex subunit 5 isoform X2 [Polypterus senegalus]|uniref:ER membrane protein complex subunit 5 isoform X2 n=1 Tax=Polypterus senegalus TaxID=55291 RepID=UPI001964E572|nr:ER membrane protein complex subunit 5 isoform X2 [Polypterus senegalus]
MASSVWKGLVGIGLFALAHAAFSAAQHRSYMRLTEKENETLPVDGQVLWIPVLSPQTTLSSSKPYLSCDHRVSSCLLEPSWACKVKSEYTNMPLPIFRLLICWLLQYGLYPSAPVC